ncbi:MAG TPA: lamin tail domain-containing protein, partial [Thermoanaerobaculia bacterium]|nr:lamin tail domain-containing protein [Thermoanaerobaculia bacterium]
MRRGTALLVPLAASILLAPLAASAQVVINEIDYDQPGTDAAEFVELYNAGGSPADLTDYTLELVNGNGGGAVVYQSYSLAGFVLAPGDYLVVCGNAATVANCDLDVSPDTNLVQNGAPDAVGLRSSGTLVDAVSYEGDTGAPYTEGSGAGLADPGATATDSIGRCPDGIDTEVNNVDLQALAIHSPGATNGCGVAGPKLSISDVSSAEGDGGATDFLFTITVTGTPAGTVSFEATVNDGTATVADNDYVDQNDVPLTIVPPASSTQFTVQVVGDTAVEPNETFTVTLANLVNADPGGTTGLGTIVNDDVVLTAIHDIQGSGAASPLVGQVVTTRGIVTAKRSNAFFLQAPDAQADGDPATSEGIVVFTSSAPTVAVGDEAQVTGTVVEFVPSADPQQPPITELGNPSLAVVVLSSGNPLPALVPLTPGFPDPAGPFDQLERLEGMRVSAASLTVVSPTLGSINESQATATTNGVFYGVVTGVARPFREAGVQLPDTLPAGSPANVPRFDTNPETLRVDSDGQVPPPSWAPLDVAVGGTVAGLVGV